MAGFPGRLGAHVLFTFSRSQPAQLTPCARRHLPMVKPRLPARSSAPHFAFKEPSLTAPVWTHAARLAMEPISPIPHLRRAFPQRVSADHLPRSEGLLFAP